MLRTLLLAALAVSASAQTLSIQKPDRVGRIIENEFFIADLSHRVVQELFRATKENPLKEFLEWEKKIRAEWSAAR